MLPTSVALASQDEAYGTVTNVVDGNTFDVTIEKADPRISYSVERIRLADVRSPEIETLQGPAARDFTFAVLINKRVYLDIDDLSGSGSGRDIHGSLICVAYLTGFYGQPLVSPNFNRLLVDAGHAKLENSANNEFDPQDWWSEEGTPSVARPLPDLQESPQESLQQSSQKDTPNDLENNTENDLENNTENDLKGDLQKNILPRLQEYAEKELDRAAEEGWNWLKGQIKV